MCRLNIFLSFLQTEESHIGENWIIHRLHLIHRNYDKVEETYKIFDKLGYLYDKTQYGIAVSSSQNKTGLTEMTEVVLIMMTPVAEKLYHMTLRVTLKKIVGMLKMKKTKEKKAERYTTYPLNSCIWLFSLNSETY